MTPQELKNSILQLAIQGKLVPQRAEEGTAEELYNQIQAEKQKLIKAGKIKKEKPLPEITDDEKPFEIPDSWTWVRLGDLLQVIGGVSYKKTEITKQGIRILRGGNIQNFKVLFDEDDVFLPLTYNDDDKNVRAGDIIVVASTGSKNVIGKAAYVDIEIGNTMVGAFLRICRPYYAQIVDYLKYLFDSYYYRQHIRDMAQGTNINNVKESYITELLYPLPPLAEQKRIVAKIEELLPYVERYEKAYNELQQFNKRFPGDLQKSVLQLAIQGRLVPQCPEEGNAEDLYKQIQDEKQKIKKLPIFKGRKNKSIKKVVELNYGFDIPENWKWIRLGEVVEIFGRIGFRGYTKNDLVSKGNGAITLSPSNIKADGKTIFENCTYISWEKYNESPEIMIFENDLLVVKTGSSYGKCGLVTNLPEKATINPQLAVLKYVLCNKEYLQYALNSYFVKQQYEKFVIGTSIPTFSQEKLANIIIPLPPLEEQKRIVAKIEEILPLCDKLK